MPDVHFWTTLGCHVVWYFFYIFWRMLFLPLSTSPNLCLWLSCIGVDWIKGDCWALAEWYVLLRAVLQLKWFNNIKYLKSYVHLFGGHIRQLCKRNQTASSLISVSVDSLHVLVWTTLTCVTWWWNLSVLLGLQVHFCFYCSPLIGQKSCSLLTVWSAEWNISIPYNHILSYTATWS